MNRTFSPKLPAGKWLVFWFILSVVPPPTHAQDSYEIQVYGAETVARGETMIELQLEGGFCVDLAPA